MRDVKLAILLAVFFFTYSFIAGDGGAFTPKIVLAYVDNSKNVSANPDGDNKPSIVAVQNNADTIDGVPIPEGYELWKTVKAKVTAYDPSEVSCSGTADGLTSTMTNAWRLDGCAVNPNVIPYGTMVYIPDVGFRKADDTGSAMKRSWNRSGTYHVDVRMAYPYQARQWGVKWLKVYLFREK